MQKTENFMNDKEAAEFLRLSPQTLRNWRTQSRGTGLHQGRPSDQVRHRGFESLHGSEPGEQCELKGGDQVSDEAVIKSILVELGVYSFALAQAGSERELIRMFQTILRGW